MIFLQAKTDLNYAICFQNKIYVKVPEKFKGVYCELLSEFVKEIWGSVNENRGGLD